MTRNGVRIDVSRNSTMTGIVIERGEAIKIEGNSKYWSFIDV